MLIFTVVKTFSLMVIYYTIDFYSKTFLVFVGLYTNDYIVYRMVWPTHIQISVLLERNFMIHLFPNSLLHWTDRDYAGLV